MKMKKIFAAVLSGIMLLGTFSGISAEDNNSGDLILHYDFSSAEIAGETFGGVTIKNGYAYFDGVDDYIKMPDSIVSGCEEVTFVINVRPDMNGANQFTFTVGNSSSNYLFFNTNNGSNARFAMTTVGWWQEEGELKGESIPQGEWASVIIVMDGKTKRMYINGEAVSETTSELLASSLGDTTQNYLAKSQYSDDLYFKGYIDDFRIYSTALTKNEIDAIYQEHVSAQEKAEIVADRFAFDFYNLTEDAIMPEAFENASITWESSDESIMTNDGKITRGEEDKKVTMTATFALSDNLTAKREYTFNIIHEYTDMDKAMLDLMNIHLVGNLKNLKEDLYLSTESEYGSTITWKSDDESVVTNNGEITRAKSGEGSRSTTLTVTATNGEATVSKEYEIVVEEEDFVYLFAYFASNSQEKVFYGLSKDGYHFNTINNGNPVLESTKGNMGVRDPFIMEGQNGKYYCLLTDMNTHNGSQWNNQNSIIIFESEDLINWDEGTIIDFNQFGWYNRAWAPQAIWDPEFYDEETGEYGAYMIYLALSSGGPTQMYKVYSRDMKTLITEPEILYKRADNLDDIDSDIIYKDGLYYMYVKDESAGGIYVVTSRHAGGPYSERINALPRKNTNGSDVAIEGSGIYKLMNEDKYNIVYDAYLNGFFIMTETEDLVNFTQLDRSDYSFNFTPRHGYVITISKAQCDALQEAYGQAVPGFIEGQEEPILYYDFEDETDKSGNFFNAQLTSSAAFAQSSLGGKALKLNGTSDSYVTIPSEAIEGLEDYTVSAWINTNTTENTQRVFDFGTDTNRYMFLTPYYSGGVVRGAITAGSYSLEKGVSVAKTVETGRWTHMVMSQEGETLKLYIDGVLVGQTENVQLDPYEIAYSIPYCYIGRSMWSGDRYFNGMIDEFRIYNRAITDEEVTELYLMDVPTYEMTATDSEVVFIARGAVNDMTEFTVVIAQYSAENILVNVKSEKINVEENTECRVATPKVGENYKVFLFDSMQNIKPIN